MEEKAGVEQFAALMQLVATLRGENGCPWDRAQTPASMKKYLLEECQELIEAIDSGEFLFSFQTEPLPPEYSVSGLWPLEEADF